MIPTSCRCHAAASRCAFPAPFGVSGEGARKASGKGPGCSLASPQPTLVKALQISPDFEHTKPQSDTSVAFVHRKISDGDIYYVYNRKNRSEKVEAAFRLAGKRRNFGVPRPGAIEPASYRVADGRTTVSLKLDPAEAVFIVFRKAGSAQGRTLPQVTDTAVGTIDRFLDGRVSAQPGRPASVTLDKLERVER